MKKRIFMILLPCLFFIQARSQTLSSYWVRSSTSMRNPGGRVYYLQSFSGNDITVFKNVFLELNIYHDVFLTESDSLKYLNGDYALGNMITDQGDTVMACFNKDLSIRFLYPARTTRANPFLNGISKCSYSPWWAFHAGDSKYGAVTRQGLVLFEPEHLAVTICQDKAVAVDYADIDSKMGEGAIIIKAKRIDGETEFSYLFYYPLEYDSSFEFAGNDFWSDIENPEADDYSLLFLTASISDSFYSALVKMVQMDYMSARALLKKALKDRNPAVRRCARKNLKTMRQLFLR